MTNITPTDAQIFSFVLGREPSEDELADFVAKGAIASIQEFVGSYEFNRFTLDPFFEGDLNEVSKPLDRDLAYAIMQSVFLDPGFGRAASADVVKFDRRLPAVVYTLLHPYLLPVLRPYLPDAIARLRQDRDASTEDISLCYRMILGREPESETAVTNLTERSVNGIVSSMLLSDEFILSGLFIRKEGGRLPADPWKLGKLLF